MITNFVPKQKPAWLPAVIWDFLAQFFIEEERFATVDEMRTFYNQMFDGLQEVFEKHEKDCPAKHHDHPQV